MIFQVWVIFLPQLCSWVLWFLAVHLHLRYKGLVTHRRVVVVVISVRVLSGIFSLLPLWNLYEAQRLIRITGGLIGFLLTVVIYTKIFLSHNATRIRFRLCR